MAAVLRTTSSPLLGLARCWGWPDVGVGPKTHIPEGLHQNVLGIQRASFYRVDPRSEQARGLQKVLSSRQNLDEILFFHRLSTLWVPKHESVRVKLRNRRDIEVMVSLLVAAKELFDGDGGHVFIEAGKWTESELIISSFHVKDPANE